MSTKWCVVGDPIQDTYHYLGDPNANGRYVNLSHEDRLGGAGNIWNNLQAILGKPRVAWADFLFGAFPDATEVANFYGPQIHRYVCQGKLLLETVQLWESRHMPKYECPGEMASKFLRRATRKVLVVGDYNKGVVSTGSKMYTGYSPKVDLVVVDSRYRTLDLRLIQNAKVKVWHCTGNEYNSEWARNFDWVVHSNGPNQVWVRPGATSDSLATIGWVDVPETKIVDTCGAGDTMTAALAAWLGTYGESFDAEEVLAATTFAVEACQDVIQKLGTAVTDKRIK